jgi:hypothetical protein
VIEEPHYVRQFNRWVPEPPPQPRRRWTAAQWSLIIGLIMAATSIVVLLSMVAGNAAADSFGPLIPPSPTPFPEGWTP